MLINRRQSSDTLTIHLMSESDGGARRNETLHSGRQAGDALAGLQRPPNEGGAERMGQPDTQHHGEATDLIFPE
jgi:hypothetical protein